MPRNRWGKVMPNKMGERSASSRKSYSPPSLTVYGGMAKLTASGTGTQSENTGQASLTKKP